MFGSGGCLPTNGAIVTLCVVSMIVGSAGRGRQASDVVRVLQIGDLEVAFKFAVLQLWNRQAELRHQAGVSRIRKLVSGPTTW